MFEIPISYSKALEFRKVRFRGHSAAVSSDRDVVDVVEKIKIEYQDPNCINTPFAYRFYANAANGRQQLCQGFEDAGEFGAGEKILHLLQKWDVRNVVVVVTMQSVLAFNGRLGFQRYRYILDCAKQVLEQCFLEYNGNGVSDPDSDDSGSEDSMQVPRRDPTIHAISDLADAQNERHTGKTLCVARKQQIGHHVESKTATIQTKRFTMGPVAVGPYHQATQSKRESTFNDVETMVKQAIPFVSKSSVIQLKATVRPTEFLLLLVQCVGILVDWDDLTWGGLRELVAAHGFRSIFKWPSRKFTKESNVYTDDEWEAINIVHDVIINQLPGSDDVAKISNAAKEIHQWLVTVVQHCTKVAGDDRMYHSLSAKFGTQRQVASGGFRLSGKHKVATRLAYAKRQQDALEAHQRRRECEENSLPVALDEFTHPYLQQSKEQHEILQMQRAARLARKQQESRKATVGVLQDDVENPLPLVLVNNRVQMS